MNTSEILQTVLFRLLPDAVTTKSERGRHGELAAEMERRAALVESYSHQSTAKNRKALIEKFVRDATDENRRAMEAANLDQTSQDEQNRHLRSAAKRALKHYWQTEYAPFAVGLLNRCYEKAEPAVRAIREPEESAAKRLGVPYEPSSAANFAARAVTEIPFHMPAMDADSLPGGFGDAHRLLAALFAHDEECETASKPGASEKRSRAHSEAQPG